jgi:ribonucleoside-diphosphate reductase alpha chain
MEEFTMNDFQTEIMTQRYALSSEKSWLEVSKRVANHTAKAEHNGDISLWEKRFNWVMSNGYYFPGGRVLYGSGRRIGGLLNCFCKGVEDNRHSIAKLAHDMYLISTFGGGVGTNYSAIRPKGDSIQGVQGSAPGVVSEIRKIDAIGEQVKSGGGRRVALIATLSIEHPDLLDFLDVKLDLGQLNNHNISINYGEKFFDAVRNDEVWTFEFRGQEYNRYLLEAFMPSEDNDNKPVSRLLHVVATSEDNALKTAENYHKDNWLEQFEVLNVDNLMAKDLWARICKNAVESGEPGFLFEDNIKANFATHYFEEYNNCNPCTEALLPADGNCNLGSINLSLMYDGEKNDVDWSLLTKVIGISIRMMDNVLTMNIYPTPETKVVAEKSRRIGLGVMGLHHLLIKMGLRYGSEESLEFIERLFTTIRNESFKASIDIAKDKGSFPEYDYERYLENDYTSKLPTRILKSIKKYGIRNAVILSIAPTGTISMVAGVSSGIEPIFAPIYNRKYRVGNTLHEEVVVDKMFGSAVKDGKWDHIIGSYDVTPEEHMAVQAAVQDYVDQAISKTINVPKDFTHEQLMDLIMNYSDRLKGLTVYREGSRDNEPLSAIKTTKKNVEKYAMVEELQGVVSPDCAQGSCEL